MVQKLEALTRAGEFAQVQRELREIQIDRLARSELLPLANIAGRIGAFTLALRFLKPIVRSPKPLPDPPTNEELAQYANSLRKLGARTESRELLLKIDREACPKAHFELALCYMAEWNYGAAVPELERYAASFSSPCYAQDVAKINLMASYLLVGKDAEAIAMVPELMENLGRGQTPLLLSVLHELIAQAKIRKQDFDGAVKNAEIGLQILTNAKAAEQRLVLRKWLAVARSWKTGELQPELISVRREAEEQQFWETVRDCDFHCAFFNRDRKAFTGIFFGTPFQSFRERIIKAVAPSAVPAEFLWQAPTNAPSKIFRLDLAQSSDGKYHLKPGQALHRLLILLCQDHYRPLHLLEAFSHLFPSEVYDPYHSANRVHQVIKRFRVWLADTQIPIELHELSGGYKISLGKGLGIQLQRDPLPLLTDALALQSLVALTKGQEFTASDLAKVAGLSRSALHRHLQWGIESGKIHRISNGVKPRYRTAG